MKIGYYKRGVSQILCRPDGISVWVRPTNDANYLPEIDMHKTTTHEGLPFEPSTKEEFDAAFLTASKHLISNANLPLSIEQEIEMLTIQALKYAPKRIGLFTRMKNFLK